MPMRCGARRRGSAAKIVQERVFEDTGGARRTDSGIVQIQRQIPVFTQSAPDHDVLVAADESEVFASYLPYRTWEAAAGRGLRRPDAEKLGPGARPMGREPVAEPLRGDVLAPHDGCATGRPGRRRA